MRCRICLPSGFGEIAIFWSKLSQVSDIQWDAEFCPDDLRGSDQLAACLPNVTCHGLGIHNTGDILTKALPYNALLHEHLPGPIYPTVDHFLIRGNHISDWLPELPIDYHYPINLPQHALDYAQTLTGDRPYLLIYPSSIYRRLRPGSWGRVWEVDHWADLCVRLDRCLSIPWYLIGSTRDNTMLQQLVSRGAAKQSQCLLSECLADTMALIKRAAYVIAFPAGPGVTAGVFNRPHCMLFRTEAQCYHRGSFTDPRMLEDGSAYLPFFSEAPSTVALEILNRLPAALKKSDDPGVPCYLPGLSVAARPDLQRSITTAGQRYDAAYVFGFLGKRAPLVDYAAYRLCYAAGRVLKPTTILQIGNADPYSVAAAVTGTLDEGVPIAQVGLIGQPGAVETEQLLKLFTGRSSHKLVVRSAADITHSSALTVTGRAVGYTFAHIDGLQRLTTLPEDLRFAYSLLPPDGLLAVTDIDHPTVRETYLAFVNRVHQPVAIWPAGWGIIHK